MSDATLSDSINSYPRTHPFRGVAFLLVGAVLISFAAVFVRLTSVGPISTGFYRVAIGGVLLLALTSITGQRVKTVRTAWWLAAAAGLMFAVDLGFWHHSILLIGPGLATILANCQVFILGAVGVLVFGEKFSLRYAMGTVLAFGGLFLLFGRNWFDLTVDYRVGVVFGALTAGAYASYLLLLRRLQHADREDRSIANLSTITLISAAFLAITVGVSDETFAIPTLYDAGILAALALTAQVLGWLLISKGLPLVEASRAGLILLLQPTLAFVWDVLFFARPVGAADATGALLAIAGIYFGARTR